MKPKNSIKAILLILMTVLLLTLASCGESNTNNSTDDTQIRTELDSSETEASETETSETETSENGTFEAETSETETSEKDTSKSETSETETSETPSSELQSSETPSSEVTDSEITPTPMAPLKAMSFNIYIDTPTPQRESSVIQTIENYMPDTIGLQEVSSYWMNSLLTALGDTYASAGKTTDGSTDGSYSPIFYRTDRFELIEEGTKWLSQTPNIISRIPESSLYRVLTYVILRDKASGQEILVANTHLDHLDTTAREKQVAIIHKILSPYMDKYPIVLTGDFNDNDSSTMYQNVKAVFCDSSRIAKKAERCYTFHNYGKASVLMDYIFLSKDTFTVSSYKVITDQEYGMLPSDHYPVYIEYEIIE